MNKTTATQDSTVEVDNVEEEYPSFQINHADNIRIFYNQSGSISIACDETESVICIDLLDINYVSDALRSIKTAVEWDQ